MVEREEVRVEVDGRVLTLTNLGKVIYPRTGMTKGEVLNYYAQVAPVLLPQLRDRAVTRIRWPHGVGDMSFFEKNAPAGTPSWVRTATVPTTGSRTDDHKEGTLSFPIVDGLAALTWVANLSALELHVHQWTVGADGTPAGADRIVIDLDPGEPAGLQECCQVAMLVRDALGARELSAVPVLSGSKGLHLYAALPEPVEPDVSTALAKEIAEDLQKANPSQVTATMTKSRRSGKVFLDWSQNSGSKTTICPYSLRGKEIPKVAAPITWDEVEKGAEDPLGIDQLGPNDVVTRVSVSGDPFTSPTGP
ncbi:MAG: non-homologous end-joining DNA ligase [Nocardioides sp.]|uniref:non-homologous end-joining DNA ligase n=1 Tax=Nocardioides sp. TaxID=35761 RepID=UPI003D6A3AAC